MKSWHVRHVKYANCKCSVLLEEGFATCTNCSVDIIEMYCMKYDKLKCIFIDKISKSKKKYIGIIKITAKYYTKINTK